MSVCSIAQAAPPTVVYDGFNYSTGSIVGKNGGTGWSGAWYRFYGSGGDMQIDSNTMSYTGLTTAAGKVVWGSGGNQISQAERALSSTINSGVVYIQFLANVESGGSGGGTPQIRLRDGGTNTVAFGGNGGTYGNYWSILSPSLGAMSDGTSSTTTLLNSNALILVRIDYNASNVKMWTNPNLATFDYYNPPAAQATYNSMAPAFNSVGLYTRSPGSYDEFRIMQINGNPPTDIALSNTNIDENNAASATIGTLSTTDVDGGSFTYSLVSGTGDTDNGSFTISGSDLRLTPSANYEAKSSYAVRIQTADAQSNTYEEAFTITINNLPETPTDITLSSTSVAENVAGNTAVGTLGTTDSDAGDTFTYDFAVGAGDTDNAAFNISGSSLRISSSPDYETKSSYSIRLITTDSTSRTFEKQFTISITNVNEAPTISDVTNQTINEDGNTGALAITVGDVETAASSLTMSGSSSNTTLIPNGNIVFGGSGTSRTVTITPAANLSGTATITVTVNDGGLTASDTFTVTVNAVNDVPTISNITDRTIEATLNTGALVFTISDVETATASLIVSGSSSDTGVIPNGNIVFGGAGASRTVTVTAPSGVTGTSTITVQVSDGVDSITDTFDVTVIPFNEHPTVSDIANQTIDEDTNTGALAFTVGDAETAAGSLTLSGTSTNTTLIPNGNIVFGGSGASRTVTVTPAANLSGTSTITVTASDGVKTGTDTFTVTVTAVNDTPTIGDVANQTVNEDVATSALAFTVGDVESAAATLTLSGSSSDTAVVPNGNIVFGGSGASRTVTVTPAANASGTATITITVSDSVNTASDTFTMTVNAVNDAPTISDVTNQTVNEDVATSALAFTISDVETAAASLTMSGGSSNTTLVPVSNIVFGGSGASRTVTVTPAANTFGTATITLTVNDGTTTTNDTFTLTVNAVNDTPTISDVANQTIDEDNATSALAITIGDVETAAASLTMSGSSSNTTLVPNTNIVFGGSGASRTVVVTPVANGSGTATITVTVSDGSLTSNDTFTLTVNAVNDAPSFFAGDSQLAYETVNPIRSSNNIVYAVNNSAALASTTFSRVRYRMQVNVSGVTRYADVSFDGWSGLTVSGLQVPTPNTPFVIQRNVSNMTVDSNYATVTNATGQTGRLEIWPYNYSQGAAAGVGGSSGTYDFDDTHAGSASYGSFQVHNLSAATKHTVLAWNNHSSNPPDVGFGNRPTADPDWTFAGASGLGITNWKLQIYIGTDGLPSTFAVIEDTESNLLMGGTPFVDPDASSLTVTLAIPDGVITGNAGTGVTVGGSATSRTFTGTVADLNTYFTTAGKVTYLGAANNITARTLTITSDDGVAAPTVTTATVNFTPVNDAPTDIALSASTINEGNAANATVGTLSSTDLDTSDTFTYTLVSGTGSTDNASFTISGTALRLTPVADYETKNNYSVRIRTTDSSSGTYEEAFTITINDVSETPTDITLSSTSVAENSVPNTVVGNLGTPVSDLGETFTYTLVSGTGSTDNAAFNISGNFLQINASPDYETKSSYAVRLRTTDSSSAFFEKQFTITITNVNEGPSISDVANQTINEDGATSALAITISDPETAAASLTMSAASTDTTLVPVSNVVFGGSGAARTVTITPVANLHGSATITITVSDGSLTASDTFLVTVNPVNDAPSFTVPAGAGGGTWVARDSTRTWYGVASSADGTKLAAAAASGLLYTSTDSGVTWTARNGPTARNYNSIASSSDGAKLIASVFAGQLFTSTDSGLTWTARESVRNWLNVASSADGIKLVAVVQGGQIYTSTDSGVTWTARDSNRSWWGVASSADGTKLVATADGGLIYTSTNSGLNWTARDSARNWRGVTSSADGSKLVAAALNGQLYTSTDSGVSWTARDSNRQWTKVASSADGTLLVAAAKNDNIYTSSDSGVTWTARSVARGWWSVASSADGTKLAAGVENGMIYTSSGVGAYTLTVAEDAGPQSTASFATSISPGPSNESAQALTFDVSNNNNSLFSTQPAIASNGTLTFTTASNANGTATVTVTLSDDGGTANSGVDTSAAQTFTITATAVNDAPSDISLSSSSIAENNAANATVGTLSATDTDSGDTHTFTIVAGTGDTDNGSFTISGASLRLTPSADYETKNSYSVRVRATDNGTGSLTYEEALTIAITNVDEGPTDLILSATAVAENVGANTVVGTFSTTAPEVGTTFTYTLVSGTGDTDNSAFNISGANLRITGSPDHEVQNSYDIRVRTTDSNSLFIEEAFTITITNVNESPTDLVLSASTILENSPANTTVGTLSTTDEDIGETFTYTLVSGAGSTDNSAFNISGNALRMTNSPDFTVQNSYTARVRTTDANGLYIEQAFAISVIAPEIGVSEAAVAILSGGGRNYGPVALGASASRTFTIVNTGSADLTGISLSVVGAHPSNFVVTASPAASIPALTGLTTFTVQFTPSALGARAAVLRIASSDDDEDPFTITLSGKGGKYGAALAFDGVDDTLEIDSHADFSTPTFTVEGWVKPSSSMPQWARLWATENNRADLIVKTGSENRFSFAPVIDGEFYYVHAPATWTTGQWYHVAGVVDHTMIRLFVNGVEVASRSKAGAWAGDPGKRYIGRCTAPAPPNRFQGVIDEVRYWNYARNCDQISQARNGELTGSEDGLVAYYQFNQGVADCDNSALTTADDATGNGHDGALTNFSLADGNATSNWTSPGGVTSGTLAPVPQFVELDLKGNAETILDGDTTPTDADHTDFGDTSVTSTRTFTLENLGNIDLDISDIEFTGTGAADFELGGITLPAVIPGGSSTTFTVTVEATSTESRQATLTITSTDCDEGTYDVAIQSIPSIDITTTGGALALSDPTSAGGTLEVSEPAAGSIQFSNETRAFTVDGGARQFGDSGALSLTGTTSITITGNGGDDEINIDAFTASLPGLAVMSSAGDDTLNFAGNLAIAEDADLTVDLNGSVNVAEDAEVTASGDGSITVTTSKDVTLAANARLQTEDGDLTVAANQQALATAGDFAGVLVSGGSIEATGAGAVTVSGKGGDDSGGQQAGVRIQSGGEILSDTGLLTIIGTGGASTGLGNYGVYVTGAGSTVSSTGNNVSVTGIEGTGSSGIAIVGQSASSFVTAAATGTITLIGNSMLLDATTSVTTAATGSVTLRPLTNGVSINLGLPTNVVGGPLSLTDGELDRISTGTLNIGDANSGTLVQSGAISRSAATLINVTSGGNIDLRAASFGSGGGNLRLNAASGTIASGTGVDINTGAGGALSFAGGSVASISIEGPAVNSGYQQFNVTGGVDLSGATLILTGAHVPVKGQSFVLINNDGTDAVTGAFAGLPEGATVTFNGVPMIITYTGGTGNDVTLGFAAPTLTVAKSALTAYEGSTITNAGTLLDLQGNVTLSANIGSVTNVGNGTWTWTYTPADGPEASGTVVITAEDDSTVPLSTTVSFTLAVKNLAPVAQAQTLTLAEDAGTTAITLAAPDAGSDSVTYAIVAAPAAASGTLSTISGNVVNFTPAANFAGTATFRFKATDSDGAVSQTAAVTINVTGSNDAPVFTKGADRVHPTGTATAQSVTTWAKSISDGDPDLSQTVAFTVTEVGTSNIFTTAPAISSTGTLTYQPNGTTGTATFSVTLTDSDGATSAAQTFTITVAKFSPGSYTGLAEPDTNTTPSKDNLGLFAGTLTSTGSFSAKVNFGGTATNFTAVFSLGTGNASGTLGSKLAWNLHLDVLGGTDKITGTVTKLSGGVPTDVCEVDADRATFSSSNRVPARFLNSANAGVYTLAFPSKAQTPEVDADLYPQGDGFGKITLNSTGGAMLAGTLADGTTVTASASLSKTYQWPLAILIKSTSIVSGTTLGGMVQFDTTVTDSDLSASDLRWFRPALSSAKYYAAGWPAGISVDAVGALYSSATNIQNTLGITTNEGPEGGAELVLSDGKLTETIIKSGIKVSGNVITKSVSGTTFTLLGSASTGAFSGTFTPNWASPATAKPTFKGILIQKGASKGGYGFFLSNAQGDTSPKSGGVTFATP